MEKLAQQWAARELARVLFLEFLKFLKRANPLSPSRYVSIKKSFSLKSSILRYCYALENKKHLSFTYSIR